MKCVCGYEYVKEYTNAKIEPTVIAGDEEFIEIDVKATRTSTGWHRDLIAVSVYCCPKCSTLRCD